MRQHKGDTIALITSISGPSGSGKTHSFKNLNWDETFVFRPNRKPFSFPKSHLVAKPWNSKRKAGNFTYIEDYSSIFSRMQKLVEYGKKVIIIDDSTHLMTGQFMNAIDEVGFEKFNQLAYNYYQLIKNAESLPDDVRVYFINHVELDANANLKVKTIGKLLDEKVDIPSFFTICLGSSRTNDGYRFQTQTSGRDFFKSPSEMFEDEHIPNDLKLVDDAICEYYGIGLIESEDEPTSEPVEESANEAS